MRKTNKSTCTSRKEARNKFQKRFNGKLRADVVVHHKDLNPFNNDSSNLELQMRTKHSQMHFKAQMQEYWKQRCDGNLNPLFKQLNDEIKELNNFLDSTSY